MNSNVKKLNEKNAYLIGSKPETMKMDIIMFKEEVLVELKQLNNSLAEKYRNTGQEVKDKLELFEKKLNDYSIKLSELSSKIIVDTKSQEKIAELLIFKDKAQDIMTSNRIKLNMYVEETRNSIDRIDSILKESVIYPGTIGSKCKFKTFHEYIDYTLLQIAIMNNFKEKNTMDLSTYKRKIEDLFSTIQLEMDNNIRAMNIYSIDVARKTEQKFLKELEISNNKIKELKIQNLEFIVKLNKEVKEFIDEFNLIKKIKNDMDEELKNIKKNNIDYINNTFKKYNEKYNKLENKIEELNFNIHNTASYLTKEAGAKIKIIQDDEIYSSNEINKNNNILHSYNNNSVLNIKGIGRKSIILRNKSHFDIINENINSIKNNSSPMKNNNFINKRLVESAKDRIKNKSEKLEEENKDQKERPKSSKRYVSDIMKYIKGEIKANEIGSLTKFHHKNQTIKDDKELKDPSKDLKEKQNQNNEFRTMRSKTFVNRKKKDMVYNINKALDDSFENKKTALKTDKKIKRNTKQFKKIVDIELNDLDAQYHGNNISSTSDFKNIKTTEEIINKQNKINNNNINFKSVLENLNFNTLKNKNFNFENNNKKNTFRKSLSTFTLDKFDNINNIRRMIYNNSNKTLFPYNNSLIKNNNNNLNLFNNNTIDSKLYQSPKMKINKILNNVFPLEINNINNYNINSLSSFGSLSISQEKNKENIFNNKTKIINNIKTSFNNKRKNYHLYKNNKTFGS